MNKLMTRIGAFLAMLGLVGGITLWQEIVIAFSEPVDINVDFPEDVTKVKAVETTIDMLIDVFAEEETTFTNRSGKVTSKEYDYYYIVPVFTADDDVYYVAVMVNSSKASVYDRIVESTWAYLDGEKDYLGSSITFSGGFVKMKDELYEYFEDWFEETEWFESEAEMKEHILPLVLKPVVYKNTRLTAFALAGMFVIGLICLYFVFFPPKGNGSRRHREATVTDITLNGVSYPAKTFEKVNKLIEKGEKGKAAQELMKITGMDGEAAVDVVNRWWYYWH